MILVTGASGTIGSAVVRELVSLGAPVRVMSRRAAALQVPAGVEAVNGDFDMPDSLEVALRGVESVFLLSAGPMVVRHDAAMIAAARESEVAKLVKLSAIGTGDGIKVGDWHLPGEQAVRSSGAVWTILRPSSFASNALRWAEPITAGNPVPNMTGSGEQGVIDPRDVAAVAARALISDDHAGQVLTLTGPELLSVPDQVTRLAAVLDRALEVVDVPLEAYRDRLLSAGVDPGFVDVAVNGSKLIADGGNAVLTDDVAAVLSRPPRPFAEWVRDHRAAFQR
jgi:uncharacterized protein YbjT (DUF2867 family)